MTWLNVINKKPSFIEFAKSKKKGKNLKDRVTLDILKDSSSYSFIGNVLCSIICDYFRMLKMIKFTFHRG